MTRRQLSLNKSGYTNAQLMFALSIEDPDTLNVLNGLWNFPQGIV